LFSYLLFKIFVVVEFVNCLVVRKKNEKIKKMIVVFSCFEKGRKKNVYKKIYINMIWLSI